MKRYTFILQGERDPHPITHTLTAGSAVSAANLLMRNNKFQGFKIVEAYCGSKVGKVTQLGYIQYEELVGKVIDAGAPPVDDESSAIEFDSLLGEVDEQCCKKEMSHAE